MLSDDHDGIIDLPADAPVGQSYVEWAGTAEPVIEINLTPNRSDCTGVNGIARDLGATLIGDYKENAPKPVEGHVPLPGQRQARLRRHPSAVSGLRSAAGARRQERSVAGLAAKAPDGDRSAADQRAGRHHQFHHLRPRPAAACVRRQEGQRQSHRAPRRSTARRCWRSTARPTTLDAAMCVIADEKGVELLAGIMGGEESGCDENTTDVLIESALWDEVNIAQTGRKLGINTDARYRFERGVDPNFMLPGLELATQMVIDFCGGEPSEIVVAGDPSPKETVIDYPVSRTARGWPASSCLPAEMRRTLERLGFFVAGQGDRVKVAVPSWRPDVHGRADIVEELVRIAGVDTVPSTPFPRGDDARKPVLTADPDPHPQGQARARRARHDRSGDLVVRVQTRSRIVRRRQAGTGARQSDRGRIVRHAAEPAGRADHLGAEERRSRLSRCRAVRSRADFQGRPAGRPIHRRHRRAPRARQSAAASAVIGRARPNRSTCSTPRPTLSPCWPAPAAPMSGAADRAGRSGLVSSRPLRHHSDRPAEHPRPFRRIASARAGGAEGRRPARRLRSDPRQHPGRQGQSRRAPSRSSNCRRSSRSSAISPLWSRARSRPATSCARRRTSTRS